MMRTVRSAMQLIQALSIVAVAITAAYPQTASLPGHNLRSPDQHYEWRVEARDPVRYELVEVASQRVLATVRDYFYDQEHALALRHARGAGVYWNDRSDLVALDEFDYRRAGRLYLFSIQKGEAKPIPIDGLVTPPAGATEARLGVRHGWESATQLPIQLTAQLRSGKVIRKPYVIEVADPAHPKVLAEP